MQVEKQNNDTSLLRVQHDVMWQLKKITVLQLQQSGALRPL